MGGVVSILPSLCLATFHGHESAILYIVRLSWSDLYLDGEFSGLRVTFVMSRSSTSALIFMLYAF